MIIRLATLEDLPAIVDIYNSTIPSRMVTADLEPVSVEEKLAWFKEHSAGKRPLWVNEEKGKICGWASLTDFKKRSAYDRTAEISIYIHEKERGRGLGSYFLDYAIQQAPDLGIKILIGVIFSHNFPSISLFKKKGFERWGLLQAVTELDGIERDVEILGLKILK